MQMFIFKWKTAVVEAVSGKPVHRRRPPMPSIVYDLLHPSGLRLREITGKLLVCRTCLACAKEVLLLSDQSCSCFSQVTNPVVHMKRMKIHFL